MGGYQQQATVRSKVPYRGFSENAGPPVRTGGPWDPGENPLTPENH